MVTYRKAEQRDKESFITLEREFYKLYDDLEINKHLKPLGSQNIPEQALINDFDKALSDESFFMVAESDGMVVGYTFAEIVDSETYNDYYEIKSVGYIDSVYVTDKFRGGGVGTELINRAHEWFRSKNVFISTLGVRQENKKSLALFEKMGFHRNTTIEMWKQI